MLHRLLLFLPCLLAFSCDPDLFLLRPPGGTSLHATSSCPGSITASHLQFLSCPDQPGTKEEKRVELKEGVAHLEHLHPHSLYLVRLERGGEVVREENITTRAALPDGGPVASIASVSASSLKFTWPRIDIECKKHRSQLGAIRYILKTKPEGEIIREGQLELSSTTLELSELEVDTSYSLNLHLARTDGRWDGRAGSKVDATTLPLSHRFPPHLLLLFLPVAIVLLGLLVLLLVRLARRTKQKVQFKKDVKRYLQEESVNLSYRASSSSSQGTRVSYMVEGLEEPTMEEPTMEEPTYAIIPPRPRETVDPLPELPGGEPARKEAGSKSKMCCSMLTNMKVTRETSVGERSKEVGYIWMAGSRIFPKEKVEEEKEKESDGYLEMEEYDDEGDGYLRANFGHPPLKEDEIVDIPAVSYVTKTNPASNI